MATAEVDAQVKIPMLKECFSFTSPLLASLCRGSTCRPSFDYVTETVGGRLPNVVLP